MTEENMRGVKFNLMDLILSTDAIYRGGGQIIPTARRAIYASQLTASPRFFEPVYLWEIQCLQDKLIAINESLLQRRGVVISEENLPGDSQIIIKAYLPVAESFGFDESLKFTTQSRSFSFDHWDLVPGNPFDESSKSGKLVEAIRKRKGLKPGIPALQNFMENYF